MTPTPKHPTLYILQSGEGCFCQFRAYEREQLLAAKKDSLSTESLMKAQKKKSEKFCERSSSWLSVILGQGGNLIIFGGTYCVA